jgi:hypothetical protein
LLVESVHRFSKAGGRVGDFEGALVDGDCVGVLVIGETEGFVVGLSVGTGGDVGRKVVGANVVGLDGALDGLDVLGALEGVLEGVFEGVFDGVELGRGVGDSVG